MSKIFAVAGILLAADGMRVGTQPANISGGHVMLEITEGKPLPPTTATQYNGVQWPDAVFDDEEVHFFGIGDWGGVCSWENGNRCYAGVKFGGHHAVAGMPFPMDNTHGGARRPQRQPLDSSAQVWVAETMMKRAKDLRSAGTPPRFVVNVGDNFYPGGIDSHCGENHATYSLVGSQFEEIFEKVYRREDLGDIEWWSVLGNHDYGGVCYVKGWDQQIFYTWSSHSRWVMPAPYWKRHVQAKGFSADFYFLDTNILNAWHPAADPNHNICSQIHNPGGYCPLSKWPGDGASCAKIGGPGSMRECREWFLNLWADQLKWMKESLASSTADWQILVTHFPMSYSPGAGSTFILWDHIADEYGIDLFITGHAHLQRLRNRDGEVAEVITGGGGGITSDGTGDNHGNDDMYGFVDFAMRKEEITISMYSHGGANSEMIVRKQGTIRPRQRPGQQPAPASEGAADDSHHWWGGR